MSENAGAQTQQPPQPNADLKSLEKLVGTWNLSGGATGTIRFEWMEGGFFLVQHVDLEHAGNRHRGIEIIGHEQKFGHAPSPEIKSRYYDYKDGTTFDYVYEVEGDTLMIWAGEKNSAVYCKGTFSDGGDTMTAEWFYPGGGYQVTGTRVG